MEKKIQKYKEALTATDPETLSILEQDSVDENFNKSEEVNAHSDKPEDTQEHSQEHEEEEVDIETEEDLPQDILAALGEGGQDDNANYGAEIKPEIVKIINTILTDGMNKEMHESLSKTKIPRNIKLLVPPRLNTEFAGLLNNSMTNRDNLLKDRQQDLGRAIALITETINDLTKKDFDKLQAIKSLSDSIRLLSNLHYNYTQIRRKMIAPFMDKSLTQNLSENKRSEFLYSKLEESVKTSSSLQNFTHNQHSKTQKHTKKLSESQAANRPKPVHAQNKQHKLQTKTIPKQSGFKLQASAQQQQVRSTRRPTTSHHRGGRARYP
ncbi:myelin transcription factor 1-like protein [Cydia pomonella]|uniref:myelin transcription factor 1-like protein n=1 Tax=Cydia pomonella TaxID=82600 RepID=UPI002ADDBB4F|nr:myelin transcription factor 1-like protein [Cydia pomonella]